ncbi:MAG: hypothetical protein GXO47_11520 [Chlorobi bacterium]|nr:hypothetical protein [Chlorobiota bacterium]
MEISKLTVRTVIFLLSVFIGRVYAQDGDNSQEFIMKGKVEGKIFTDFNYCLNKGDDTKNFELKRAYFGYGVEFAKDFFAKIRVDVGGAEFITPEINNQYVFFKTAAVYYKTEKLMVGFGLQDTYQFKVEENLWGKRYVMPTMPDYQKFNFSADIGVAFVYRTDNFDFDFSFFNGQGYKQFDADNAFRTGLGVTSYLFDRRVILRAFGDYSTDSLHLASFTGLAGLKLDRFTFGAEYTYQHNYIYTDGHVRSGYSLFSQYNFTDKLGLWMRIDGVWSDFDNLSSEYENAEDYISKWEKRDGLYSYTGIEYVIVPKHLTTSLNYQHHTPDGKGNANTDFIYFNVEVKW